MQPLQKVGHGYNSSPRPMMKSMVIGNDSYTFVEANPYDDNDLDTRNGERVLFLSLKALEKYTFFISSDGKDVQGRENHGWRVPT